MTANPLTDVEYSAWVSSRRPYSFTPDEQARLLATIASDRARIAGLEIGAGALCGTVDVLTAENERLREALTDCVDSLEYVERVLPRQSGCAVRQERIAKAKALAANTEGR